MIPVAGSEPYLPSEAIRTGVELSRPPAAATNVATPARSDRSLPPVRVNGLVVVVTAVTIFWPVPLVVILLSKARAPNLIGLATVAVGNSQGR